MQFYKFTGINTDESWTQANGNRQVMHDNISELSLKSRTFNEKLGGKAFFFMTRATDRTFVAGAICAKAMDISAQIQSYLDMLNLKVKDIQMEEITLTTTFTLLRTADRLDYIEDDDEILEQFGLDKLTGRFCRNLDYGENLIQSANKTAIYKYAESYLMKAPLVAELDRIYMGRSKGRTNGHPVHYMVQTDDADTRRGACQLLLQALYANHRLCNKRYCFVDFFPGEGISEATYEQLYKANAGGTVIVRYLTDTDAEDNYADAGRDTIESLCKIMKKYAHQVLTVFCLPRECTKSKEAFYENLGTTSIVELKEDFVSGEPAKQFLKMLAREAHVRTDKRLFAKLKPENSYLAPELRELFDSWYNEKIKTDVYPQYKEFATVKRAIQKAAPKGSAYDELMDMIGLSEAKKIIEQALNYYKAQKLFANKGMTMDRPAMHMVFTGNPGTAKTSTARLFARIMKENNLLSKGRMIEVGRGDLVGKYVGWTAPIIQKKFKEAEGSVLFIDEAYSLVDGRDGSFGDEAINTIVQEMENHRSDVVVIFAGYPDEMERFLQKNPGLRSRIAFHVPFADYSVDELCDIASLIAQKSGLRLEEQAQEKLETVFAAARKESDFGNGRYARNIIEKAKMAQATRLLAKDYACVGREDIATLCAEDIELPQPLTPIHTIPMGFSA